MQATNDTEPLVRGSWPLTITDGDGRLLWHVAGSNPPRYEADEKLEALWRKGRRPPMLNQIITGDARDLAQLIPDASIDLIFTDPVYENIEDYAWLAEQAARALKPDRACLAFCSIGLLSETIQAMRQSLTYRWQFIEYRTNEVKHRHAPGGKCVYVPLLWLDKGKRRPSFVLDVRAVAVHTSKSNHIWSKPPITISYYLNAFTKHGDLVWDPFVGGGTIAAVAKAAGRNFIASEINSNIAAQARDRLAQVQVMDPIFEPEQVPMFESEAA